LQTKQNIVTGWLVCLLHVWATAGSGAGSATGADGGGCVRVNPGIEVGNGAALAAALDGDCGLASSGRRRRIAESAGDDAFVADGASNPEGVGAAEGGEGGRRSLIPAPPFAWAMGAGGCAVGTGGGLEAGGGGGTGAAGDAAVGSARYDPGFLNRRGWRGAADGSGCGVGGGGAAAGVGAAAIPLCAAIRRLTRSVLSVLHWGQIKSPGSFPSTGSKSTLYSAPQSHLMVNFMVED
jgi:hypothetical protein